MPVHAQSLHAHLKDYVDEHHAHDDKLHFTFYIFSANSIEIIYIYIFCKEEYNFSFSQNGISKVHDAFQKDFVVVHASCLFLRRPPWFYSTNSIFGFAENSCQMKKMQSALNKLNTVNLM